MPRFMTVLSQLLTRNRAVVSHLSGVPSACFRAVNTDDHSPKTNQHRCVAKS
jgi:hypothetical protein